MYKFKQVMELLRKTVQISFKKINETSFCENGPKPGTNRKLTLGELTYLLWL